MGDDIFADMSSTVFGKTPFSFLEEVKIQNRGMATDATEAEVFSPSKTIKAFVSTITVFHPPHDNIIVKGPPAQTKKKARHAAAVEVFKRLRLNKTWLHSAQVPIAGKKWQIPDHSFLPAGSVSPAPAQAPRSYPAPTIAASVTPVSSLPTSPVRSFTSTSPPTSPSSEVSLEWILRLTAYCSKMKIYSAPSLTKLKEEGPPNAPTFTVECEVRHSRTGESTKCKVKAKCKKQVARQVAAQGVFMKLRELDGVAWDGPPMPSSAFILEIDDVVNAKVPSWPTFEERMQKTVSPVKGPPLQALVTPLIRNSFNPQAPPLRPAITPMEVEDEDERSSSSSSSATSITASALASAEAEMRLRNSNLSLYDFQLSREIVECPELPRLINTSGGGADEILIDFDGYQIDIGLRDIVCQRPFEDCVKMGYDHLGHAAIRDLTMSAKTLGQLKQHNLVSGKRAIQLLSEIVSEQPVLPKKRTQYLELLRGRTLERRRSSKDDCVYMDYKEIDGDCLVDCSPMHDDDSSSSDSDDSRPQSSSLQTFETILGKQYCMAAKFHHQSIDFTKIGFGSTLGEAKENAAKNLVNFMGQLCIIYR